MVPNPAQVPELIASPTKNAALHFGAWLQTGHLLRGGNATFGTIELSELQAQFTHTYQPRYRSCLVLPELLATLKRYGVVKKRNKRSSNSNASTIRVVRQPSPERILAQSSNITVRSQHVYVDQNRILRGQLHRSEVILENQCSLCKEPFNNEQAKQDHVESDIHKFRLLYRSNRSSFKSEIPDAAKIDFLDGNGEVSLRTGEEHTLTVKVTTQSSYESAEVFKVIDLRDVAALPLSFANDQPIEIKVTAKFTEPGAYIYPLVVKIMPNRLCLLKDVIFRVMEDTELMDQLAPVAPYRKQKDAVVREMEGSILPGEELPKPDSKMLIKVPLLPHKIPKVYNKLLVHKLETFDNIQSHEEKKLNDVLGLLCGLKSYQDALKQVRQTRAPFTEILNAENYSDRFDLLLDFEFMELEFQIKNYDRKGEHLIKQNSKFLLQIPDLSEGRPSVKKGDKVHIRLNEEDRVTYEGVIHEVREQGLVLGFHVQFAEQYNKLKAKGVQPTVDVCFKVGTFPMQNMHRALTLIKRHKAMSIVFPQRPIQNLPPTRTLSLRPWVNPLIANNPQQQRAVQKILEKASGNAPYLVFGPPGTGKTVTLVEAIAQVWHATQTNIVKQLVCAPSNKACDNVAETLTRALPPYAKILRLYSFSTEVINVPQSLRSCSNYDEESKSIYMPPIEEILAYHVIVVTIMSAGRLVTGGAEGQFRYVYIDECGQATEPEALIAIAGLLTTRDCPNVGQLVLAGDPKQLGPILCSQLAKDFGLSLSLLERLMEQNDLYKKNEDGSGYDSNYLTKLVQNFRSHPSILSIPNRLFYDNELEVKGDKNIINCALNWKELPNKKFPLIFHGVKGLDERESNSPSYFNRHEIDTVVKYVKALINKGLPNKKVNQKDIGVITPYRKQATKFKKAFELLKWKDIEVGSVEQFQGSEKLVIFISTVRSNVALIDEDYRHGLGFLKNPKRFNVSVTRAKALLIVVGNPHILRHDKRWYDLLKYCRENGAYKGTPYPEGDPPEHEQEHVVS